MLNYFLYLVKYLSIGDSRYGNLYVKKEQKIKEKKCADSALSKGAKSTVLMGLCGRTGIEMHFTAREYLIVLGLCGK